MHSLRMRHRVSAFVTAPVPWSLPRYSQALEVRDKGAYYISVTPYAAGRALGGAFWRINWKRADDIIYAVDFKYKKDRHLVGASEALNALSTDKEKRSVGVMDQEEEEEEMMVMMMMKMRKRRRRRMKMKMMKMRRTLRRRMTMTMTLTMIMLSTGRRCSSRTRTTRWWCSPTSRSRTRTLLTPSRRRSGEEATCSSRWTPRAGG
jgi:hypothetical protein